MGITNYTSFLATATLIVMTPGIDTMFVLNRSIGEGRRSGIYSTLGINTGVILHTIFAALGLSTLIAQYTFAFLVVKYLGAAYIIYLGFANILSQKSMVNLSAGPEKNSIKNNSFTSGLITNTLNPKVALFFIALFPQFISEEHLGSPIPFIQLGLTYALIGCVWYFILSLFAASFSASIKKNSKIDYWLKRLSGSVFILMGLRLFITNE